VSRTEPIAWPGVVDATDSEVGAGVKPSTDLLSLVELTRATAEITNTFGALRATSRLVVEDIRNGHQLAFASQWRVRAMQLAGKGARVLLDDLGELGFSWRDIAKMVGVSVPAIQKWRKTGGASAANARKLADLVAACAIIMDDYPNMTEIASWFEIPLDPNAPVTPIDLWATENYQLVFELASGHIDPLEALEDFEPNWRELYRSDFDVFRAGDGEMSIRTNAR